ncbi:MAG TPA: aldo/keto reductase [Gaiellales bacterium]|jgi:aryl-alcohol dehydrogenase-like predicted oxidoreductase
MQQRQIPRLGRAVSCVGFGAWQLGADWGDVPEGDAIAALETALAAGVTFIDTADAYGDGRSERLIGRVLAAGTGERPFVATKMGRRVAQEHAEYTPARFREWTDRSCENLGVERLDLVQLHCPPTAVIEDDGLFAALDELVGEGRIGAYGVSVETCDQALAAIARPGVATIQIILNAFRLKPLEQVLPAAAAAGVGIIARVPLASGLLSGRYGSDTTFTADDHRSYNRHGEAFDVGETFSGVDFETGLEAVRRLAPLVPPGATMAQWALRFVLDQPGLSVVIPGARNPEQARANAAAAELPPLSAGDLAAVREVYDELIRPSVHDRW